MRQRHHRATVFVANKYRTVFVRHQERVFAHQITAQGEVREKMTEALNAFVGGAKPDRIHRQGNDYDPEAGTMLEHSEAGRKGRQKLYKHVPRPMQLRDVLTVKLHDRDRWNNEVDADGKPIRAFYRMTTVDGGQVDFFLDKLKPKKTTKASKKTSSKASEKTSSKE